MRRLLALACLAAPALAAAHPLGNFTINRYAALHVTQDTITVRYVLDLAEIPTFQEMQLLDADGDGMLTTAEREAYLSRMTATLGTRVLDHAPSPAGGSRTSSPPPRRALPGRGQARAPRRA